MGVLRYAFPKKYFFEQPQDASIRDFLSTTNINIDEPCLDTYPSLGNIKKVINKLSYKFTVGEIVFSHGGNQYWLSQTVGNPDLYCEIKIPNVKDDYDLVKEISFGRSSEDLVINFLIDLSKENGDFLYYCDTGQMSLISKTKTKLEIETELR